MAKKIRTNKNVTFPLDMMPVVNEKLQLFKLGEYFMPSTDFIFEIAKNIAPNARFEAGDAQDSFFEGERLVAFINKKTGESQIFPALENLQPGTDLANNANEFAKQMLTENQLFPDDGTKAVAMPAVVLNGAMHDQTSTDRMMEAEYLAYVRFERQVNEFPVYGSGTAAMIGIGANNTIQAISHCWKTAIQTDEFVKPKPIEESYNEIFKELIPLAKIGMVNVDNVRVVYYDGGGDFLQPCYRYEATISKFLTRQIPQNLPSNMHKFGFVPIDILFEPIHKNIEIFKPNRTKKTGGIDINAGIPVGRYVVRNDHPGWVNSANNFWNNLIAGGRNFINTQYYWAEPRLFTNQKDSFVNNVSIALNEVHGNWWLFSTKGNSQDLVSLSDIPTSGFTHLAFWILHSCEIVPTQTDENNSFDIWWDLFKGLHAVVGYRTEMWIEDGVTGPFGRAIGLGAPVVSAWMNAVVTNSNYGATGATYFDTNRNMTEPMGRASSVSVVGHTDDTAMNVVPLAPANQLYEWWFNN